ncbi:MAG TPA: helix-turn-helix transcriptional regulator [Pseudonocardiaceae bacterium]|jgi:transcriptional regulator with XRE-family HTH domain
MEDAAPRPDDGEPMDEASVGAILASIGAQVRAARQRRHWHLSHVAERLHLSASVVCRLELARREPSVHQLLMVCALLGLRLSEVLRSAEDEVFPLGGTPWTY